MSWTEASEKQARCAGPGSVGNSEGIARLNMVREAPPAFDPFPRRDLLGLDKNQHPIPLADVPNVCGASLGLSVVRRDGFTADNLAQQADDHALSRPNRRGAGALVSEAKALRGIRVQNIKGQVIFVYDDPRPGETDEDRAHAIIRVARIEGLEFDEVRTELARVMTAK